MDVEEWVAVHELRDLLRRLATVTRSIVLALDDRNHREACGLRVQRTLQDQLAFIIDAESVRIPVKTILLDYLEHLILGASSYEILWQLLHLVPRLGHLIDDGLDVLIVEDVECFALLREHAEGKVQRVALLAYDYLLLEHFFLADYDLHGVYVVFASLAYGPELMVREKEEDYEERDRTYAAAYRLALVILTCLLVFFRNGRLVLLFLYERDHVLCAVMFECERQIGPEEVT